VIILSFPGLAETTGARILGEIGDDRARFTDARSLKAYAGSAPVTRANGKITKVLTRKVKDQRLAAAGYVWAFATLKASPHADQMELSTRSTAVPATCPHPARNDQETRANHSGTPAERARFNDKKKIHCHRTMGNRKIY
jgi:hypothetical protein